MLYVVVSVILLYFRYHFDNDFFEDVANSNQFTDIFLNALTLNYISILNSVNIGVGFIKIFKYMRLAPRLTTMWDALFRSFSEVMALAVAILIMTLTFAVFGHINFGYRVENYSNLVKSFSTLSRAWMGEFNYVEIRDAEPRVAPWFFLFVVFFEFLFLLNMFIAIMTQYYDLVRKESDERRKELKSHNELMVVSPFRAMFMKVEMYLLRKYYGRRFHIFARKLDDEGRIMFERREKARTVQNMFRSEPKNWRVPAPDEFRKERELYLKSKTVNVLNILGNRYNSKRSVVVDQRPYRKLWWWAVHRISSMRSTATVVDEKSMKRKRKEFRNAVKETRKFLEATYGIETYFTRNWKAAQSELGAMHGLALRQMSIDNIPARITIRDIILRSSLRHKKLYGRNLYKMFLTTWGRMSRHAHRGHLSRADLMLFLGWEDPDVENEEEQSKSFRSSSAQFLGGFSDDVKQKIKDECLADLDILLQNFSKLRVV